MPITCVLHHKFEPTKVTSEIGPDPTIVADTYEDVFFAKGVSIPDNSKSFIFNSILPTAKGSMTVKLKALASSATRAVIFFSNSAGYFFAIVQGGKLIFESPGPSGYSEYEFNISYDENEVFLLTLEWDSSAGTDNYLKAYKDTTPLSISNYYANSAWASTSNDSIGTFWYGGIANNFVYDNIKIYDGFEEALVAWDAANELPYGSTPPPVIRKILRRVHVN